MSFFISKEIMKSFLSDNKEYTEYKERKEKFYVQKI